LMLMLLT